MRTEVLIVGQGISGTWLSYYLYKAGIPFLVVDQNKKNASSRVAAGIINPVTGRRVVKTWMIDELLEFLVPAYEVLGKELNIPTISKTRLIDFHSTVQMKQAFDERLAEQSGWISRPEEQEEFSSLFNYELGFAEVAPVFIVHLNEVLNAWRQKLISMNCLVEDFLDDYRITENEVCWKDIKTGRIIFCDGISSGKNPFFKNLPFAFNKGEVLHIECRELPVNTIFKKGMMLAPVGKDVFWFGSNYLWDFENDQPTQAFRTQAEVLLKSWLNVPFRITGHFAAVRPANIERRPFVGFHPVEKRIGILNGMGTKGCSLAPYFASQLAEAIIQNHPVLPEADIHRFSGILSR